MEEARKRLVELLLEADYVTSKDSKNELWDRYLSVGAVNYNYEDYKYVYNIKEECYDKKGIFYIDYDTIWITIMSEFKIQSGQVKDISDNILGKRYNFGNITTEFFN